MMSYYRLSYAYAMATTIIISNVLFLHVDLTVKAFFLGLTSKF